MDYIAQIEAFPAGCEQEQRDKEQMLQFIRTFSHNVLLRENGIAHITSSGFVVNRQCNRVLFAHHNIRNTWAWSGGHADGDSDLLGVALREAQEETGASPFEPLSNRIASLDILPVESHYKNGRFVSSHLHLSVAYLLCADEAAPLRARPGENTAVQWFDTSFLSKENFHPNDVVLYNKLVERAKRLCGR